MGMTAMRSTNIKEVTHQLVDQLPIVSSYFSLFFIKYQSNVNDFYQKKGSLFYG